MLIDSLSHVTPDGKWFNTHHDASVGRLLREMDCAGVELSVVVALADYIDNEFVHTVCAKSGGRLLPGASINPVGYATPELAAQAVNDVLCGGDFPVLKLHPRLNRYDPLDERCCAVLDEVKKLNNPVHIWLDSIFRNGSTLLSKHPVDTTQTLLHAYPELEFVLLHGGGPLLLQMAELLLSHSNLTLDISLTANYYRKTSLLQDIVFLLEKRDLRVCAGSDFPEYVASDYIGLLEELCVENELAPSKLENILGNNLNALLEDVT